MTPTNPIPNLAQDLIRIHKVITRGLNIAITKGAEYLISGFPQPELLFGYSNYAHSLASVLEAHHQGEDLIAFPAFRKVLPDAPYNRLTSDHLKVEKLLALIPQSITDLSSNAPENGLRALLDTLSKISVVWVPHIQQEEQYFSKGAISAVMDLKEQGQLRDAIGKHSQEHAGPPYWVVPFVLYNLEPEDRSAMAATFPPIIIDELVPKVWKDQWAPMQPFLLD